MTNHPNRNRSKQQQPTHTPGPWHVTHGPNIQIGTRYFVETTNSKYPISNADACLIASAPELLAALKQLHAEADRLGNYLSDKGQGATMLGLACHKASAAIAKAEGR